MIINFFNITLLKQKHNLGWFLLITFIDLVRVWSLQIISRNHPDTFLLLMMSILVTSKYSGGSIYRVVSGEFPFVARYSEKNRPESLSFIATNNWIVLAVWQSVNYFLLRIPRYSGKFWQKKKKLAIPKRFAWFAWQERQEDTVPAWESLQRMT